MKRFYCTICERVIRVRQYPANVQNAENESPNTRIGTCKWHAQPTRILRTTSVKVGK